MEARKQLKQGSKEAKEAMKARKQKKQGSKEEASEIK